MRTSRDTSASQVANNIRVHDQIAKQYERVHGEIYNDIEQMRLRSSLTRALSFVQTNGESKLALDFGCGAGNLTKHITSLGCDVLACDISQGFLDLVASRQYPASVKTVRLNGSDLSNIPDATVDMVATYSVLHHVPDYLGILAEFVRVLKPGGIVFIDHEASAEVWQPTPERLAFLGAMGNAVGSRWRKYFRPRNYLDWFIWNFVDPRYRPEGDIHVFKDDHIEWDRVAAVLESSGAEIVAEEDYLLFRRGFDESVYERFRHQTADIHLIMAKKLEEPDPEQ